MELDKILNNYLEGNEKKIIKEDKDMNSLNNNLDDYEDDEDDFEENDLNYDEDDDDEEDDFYEDDDDEEDEDENDEDEEDIDIETIDDIEKIKIVCTILNHVENDYPGLEKIIMSLQDIIDENEE